MICLRIVLSFSLVGFKGNLSLLELFLPVGLSYWRYPPLSVVVFDIASFAAALLIGHQGQGLFAFYQELG